MGVEQVKHLAAEETDSSFKLVETKTERKGEENIFLKFYLYAVVIVLIVYIDKTNVYEQTKQIMMLDSSDALKKGRKLKTATSKPLNVKPTSLHYLIS